jgi:hypothetical protein
LWLLIYFFFGHNTSAVLTASYLYEKEIRIGLLMLAGHADTIAGRIILGSNTDYFLRHLDVLMYVCKSYH